MKISFLSNKTPWFGSYSGYECLVNYFPKNIITESVVPRYNLSSRILGKSISLIHRLQQLNSYNITAEYHFLNSIRKDTIAHSLYLDQHVKSLASLNKGKSKINGTIHLPISQWNKETLKYIAEYTQIFLLYESEIQEFSKFTDINKLKFIHHGIDNDFFKPLDNKGIIKNNQILFVGHYLRDFDLFEKTYQIIQKEISNKFEYHFIIPPQHRNLNILLRLAQKKNIFFHHNLSDEQLLQFYQESYLMLMPMKDSGANTAIVQSLACGLPIITNNIGGINSYGGNSLYPTSKPKDATELANIFYKYVSDFDYRNSIAIKMRNFSLENLDWGIIAQKHLDSYIH